MKRATGVMPPTTRLPGRTSTSTVPAGASKSVRDPNRNMPRRSPARTVSPGHRQVTMRLTRNPTICTTTIGTAPSSPGEGWGMRALKPRSCLAFSPAPATRKAGRARPGSWRRATRSALTGARLTWTSSGDRKITTRVARPVRCHELSTSSTAVTNPSAGL